MITAKEENRARKRDEDYQEGRRISSGVMMLGSLAGKEALLEERSEQRGWLAQMYGVGGMSRAPQGQGSQCTLSEVSKSEKCRDEIREGVRARPWGLDH